MVGALHTIGCAVEYRHGVAPIEQLLDDGTAEARCAARHEDVPWCLVHDCLRSRPFDDP